MTKEELETLKSLKEKFEEEAQELFAYIKKNYLDVLEYGNSSCYHHCDIDDNRIWIEYFDYGYDCYDSNNIDIPINDFLSNPYEWVDCWANNIRVKKQEEKDRELKLKEKKEKEELQRLKEKYEK